MVSNNPDTSLDTKKVPHADMDVSCWNCFSVEESEDQYKKAVTVKNVRKQEREKMKLYSFIASEISKPKVVPLKQKVNNNFAVAKKLDKEISKKQDLQQKDSVDYVQDSEQVEQTSRYISPDRGRSKGKITPTKVIHKVQVDTSTPKIKREISKSQSNSHYSTIIEVTKQDQSETSNEMLTNKEEIIRPLSTTQLDKIEVASSSSGSDSGFTGSSAAHENDLVKSIEEVDESDYNERTPSDTDVSVINKKFNRSMPALNHSIENNKSKSLDRSAGSNLMHRTPKNVRWSTLSFNQKPLFRDESYVSENLSPGHATLPRRSNSPSPHERDLDRDSRFSLSKSGLQNRSESMASVYSGAGEGTRASVMVKGEVQFSLLYNYRMGALEVGVRQCRDLASVDTKKNRSDPYVKVYLLPDKSKAGKRKTKVKKNTLNPVFDETLSFVQPLASLSARTLWLSVWHADMFGRNDFLGEVTLPLADVVFDDPAPTWYKLQERTEIFDENQGTRGDLIIGLKFELQEPTTGNISRNKGTLHVLVKEAKNLVATKPSGTADVFCKSYLLPERGRLAKQKTNVSRRTLSPRWEHTFTYRGVTLQELGTRALELSLWDRDRLASNEFMGAVRLSLGTGAYMGASVNWMDSSGKEVTLWQTMMQRPNFWVEGSLALRPQLSS